MNGFREVLRFQWTPKSIDFVKDILQKQPFLHNAHLRPLPKLFGAPFGPCWSLQTSSSGHPQDLHDPCLMSPWRLLLPRSANKAVEAATRASGTVFCLILHRLLMICALNYINFWMRLRWFELSLKFFWSRCSQSLVQTCKCILHTCVHVAHSHTHTHTLSRDCFTRTKSFAMSSNQIRISF